MMGTDNSESMLQGAGKAVRLDNNIEARSARRDDGYYS